MNTYFVRIVTAKGSIIRFSDTPGESMGAVITAAFDLFDVYGISVWPV